MTLRGWNEKHGATKEAIEAIEKYARKHGLKVVASRVGCAAGSGSPDPSET